MRILIVEDDPGIASELALLAERDGYVVAVRRDGKEGLEAAVSESFSAIILDVMLPTIDGWKICSELRRKRNPTPILMLTARDSVEDRVRGLEEGADDYLPKPFDSREFLARLRALVRRDKMNKTGVIQIADLEIDTQAKIVRRAGQELRLTKREFTLLVALARNEGRTLTREMIMESVWDNEESMEGTVNFHVAQLRKKVDAPFDVKLIQTVHGFGYALKTP
jgi:DNA-binding response OmpR family regulator